MIMEQFEIEKEIWQIWDHPATIEVTCPSEDCLGKWDAKAGKPACWYCKKPYLEEKKTFLIRTM